MVAPIAVVHGLIAVVGDGDHRGLETELLDLFGNHRQAVGDLLALLIEDVVQILPCVLGRVVREVGLLPPLLRLDVDPERLGNVCL